MTLCLGSSQPVSGIWESDAKKFLKDITLSWHLAYWWGLPHSWMIMSDSYYLVVLGYRAKSNAGSIDSTK